MILVDSNIPMYLIGAEHPHKRDAQLLLERLVAEGERLVTDVEVFQEILHRYRAIGRWQDGRRVFDLARKIVSTWHPGARARLTAETNRHTAASLEYGVSAAPQ